MTAPRLWYPIADPNGGMAVFVEHAHGEDGILARGLEDRHADRLCAEHNRAVAELAGRPVISDIEAMLTRIHAAALRELVREMVPSWLRRRTKHVSTQGDKPVYGKGHRRRLTRSGVELPSDPW